MEWGLGIIGGSEGRRDSGVMVGIEGEVEGKVEGFFFSFSTF